MSSDCRPVTICAIDCAMPALALRAIETSLQGCDFGEAILFTNDVRMRSESVRIVPIETLGSRNAYSTFVLKSLPERIRTPHVLIVQWDGYVIHPPAWDERFLQYDYIGARWPWLRDGMTVGNGGFSLRSRRLLDATADERFAIAQDETEDNQICRLNRRDLESKRGIRFAPEALADAFSYERSVPERPTFGFHGLFNMWRHVDDSEMLRIVGALAPQIVASREFLELQAAYFVQRKFTAFYAVYRLARRVHGTEQLRAVLSGVLSRRELVDAMIDCGESLAASAFERSAAPLTRDSA